MGTVHMFVGIPGSGKTTYGRMLVEKYGYVMISSDKVRDDNPTMEEKYVFPEVYRLCAEALKNGKDVVFDATNITPKVRTRFFDGMKEYNISFDTIAYYFPADPKVCIERVKIRNKDPHERFLPLEVPENYSKEIIPPTLEEGFKKIIIVKQ